MYYPPENRAALEVVVTAQQADSAETWPGNTDDSQNPASPADISSTATFRYGDVPTADALLITRTCAAEMDDPLRPVQDPAAVYEEARRLTRELMETETSNGAAGNDEPTRFRLPGGAVVSIADKTPEALEVLRRAHGGPLQF